MTLIILLISSVDNLRKVSLIQRTLSTLGEMLAFKTYTYNFLILACTEVFLLTTFLGLLTKNKGRGDILGENVVLKDTTTNNSSLEVTVVFSETDDNILVSPVF